MYKRPAPQPYDTIRGFAYFAGAVTVSLSALCGLIIGNYAIIMGPFLALIFGLLSILGLVLTSSYFMATTAFEYYASIILIVLCFLIDVFAGMTVLYENYEKMVQTAMKQSQEYQTYRERRAAIQKKIDSYSQFASVDPNSLQIQLNGLEEQLKSARNELATCPSNYVTNCIKPKKAEISAIEQKKSPFIEQINGYNAYMGAVKSLTDMGEPGSGAGASRIGIIGLISDGLGAKESQVKLFILFLPPMALQFVTLFLWYMYHSQKYRYERAQNINIYDAGVDEYTKIPPPPPSSPPSPPPTKKSQQPSSIIAAHNPPPTITGSEGQSQNVIPFSSGNDISRLLNQVVADINSGKLKNLSFRSLQRQYKIGPGKSGPIREHLEKDGLAYKDPVTKELKLRIDTHSNQVAFG